MQELAGYDGTAEESDPSTDDRPAWRTQHGFLYLGWLMRGLVRENQNDPTDGNIGEPSELGFQSILELTAAHKFVLDDSKLMNSSLWTTLPRELVILVLARLPLPEIPRLRCLSSEWKTSMAAIHSEFNQACDEANPKMIALLFGTYVPNRKWIRIFDLTKRRWYACQFRIGDEENIRWHMMDAYDRGLVCFVSNPKPKNAHPLRIVVMNPLTQVQRELPPLLHLGSVRPTMVQITVDSETKCYKVIVVGKKAGCLSAEVYDSRSQEWTRAAPSCGFTFGRAFKWKTGIYEKDAVPCVYSFAEGLLELPVVEADLSEGRTMKTCLFTKDRAFVLYKPKRKRCRNLQCGKKRWKDYLITEYQSHNNAKSWTEVKTFTIMRGSGCTPLERPRKGVYMHLCVCQGFLVIFTYREIPVGFPSEYEVACILDLTTGEWGDLPKCPEETQPSEVDHYMCQVYWNVIP